MVETGAGPRRPVDLGRGVWRGGGHPRPDHRGGLGRPERRRRGARRQLELPRGRRPKRQRGGKLVAVGRDPEQAPSGLHQPLRSGAPRLGRRARRRSRRAHAGTEVHQRRQRAGDAAGRPCPPDDAGRGASESEPGSLRLRRTGRAGLPAGRQLPARGWLLEHPHRQVRCGRHLPDGVGRGGKRPRTVRPRSRPGRGPGAPRLRRRPPEQPDPESSRRMGSLSRSGPTSPIPSASSSTSATRSG